MVPSSFKTWSAGLESRQLLPARGLVLRTALLEWQMLLSCWCLVTGDTEILGFNNWCFFLTYKGFWQKENTYTKHPKTNCKIIFCNHFCKLLLTRPQSCLSSDLRGQFWSEPMAAALLIKYVFAKYIWLMEASDSVKTCLLLHLGWPQANRN